MALLSVHGVGLMILLWEPQGMPGITETQFNNLAKRVKGLEEKSPKELSFIERHQVLITLVGMGIGVAAILVSLFVFAVPQIEKYDGLQAQAEVNAALQQPAKDIQEISGEVAEIKGTLKAWTPIITSELLKNSASLNSKEFQKSLPRINKAIQAAYKVGAQIPTETISEVAQKLRTTPESSPDYWPTVLLFIQFASASLVSPQDVPPPTTAYIHMTNLSCVASVTCVRMSHAAVILDGGSIPNSVFDHCRIKFTDNRVVLKGVKFLDCIFEMPVDLKIPSPSLKKSAEVLLSSNLSQVSFNGQ